MTDYPEFAGDSPLFSSQIKKECKCGGNCQCKKKNISSCETDCNCKKEIKFCNCEKEKCTC